MNAQETIKTWTWRIKKAGHTAKSFCKEVDISSAMFSQYVNGKAIPSVRVYDKIEGKLKEMGV